jgi:hypothetical protein
MYTVADVSVITGLGDDFIIRNFHRYGPVREEFSHRPGRRRKRRFFLIPYETLLIFLERNTGAVGRADKAGKCEAYRESRRANVLTQATAAC